MQTERNRGSGIALCFNSCLFFSLFLTQLILLVLKLEQDEGSSDAAALVVKGEVGVGSEVEAADAADAAAAAVDTDNTAALSPESDSDSSRWTWRVVFIPVWIVNSIFFCLGSCTVAGFLSALRKDANLRAKVSS